MPKRTGTRSRKGGSGISDPLKYSPTSNTSSYTPLFSSSPSSNGASARPSALVCTSFRTLRPPLEGSRRASSTRIPAAGRPRAVSRTWVVRRPATVSILSLDGALDQAVGLAGGPEDLTLVLHPEAREVVEDVVLVGEGEPDLLDLRKRPQYGLAYAVERVLYRRAVVVGEGREDPIPNVAPQAVEVQVRAVAVGPVRGDYGGQDAVAGVRERGEPLPEKALPARLRRLHHEEVVEPGLHVP